MRNKFMGLALLAALLAVFGLATTSQPAAAQGCQCNPCQCGESCPCGQ